MSAMLARPQCKAATGTIAGAMLAALLAAGGLLHAAEPAQAAWTEVKAGPGGHFIVRAHINGRATQALIDTGATVVVIPWREARNMGLHSTSLKFDQPVWTANGKVLGARTTLHRVEVNGVVVHNVEALVMPKGALQRVLIGMSFLGKLRRYIVKANVLRLTN